MIPIEYTGDLTPYTNYLYKFRQNLDKEVKQGYLGKRKKTTVADALQMMQNLPQNQQQKFIMAVGDHKGTWMNKLATNKVLAPVEMLDDESIKYLRGYLQWFDTLVDATDEEMLVCMSYARLWYPKLRQPTTKVYKNFYKAVVDAGYEQGFPREELIEATNVRVCPYCNREFVESVHGSKGVVKGQLDHFYPKEKYPYLALSKYNLVPSCPNCNGASGKHNIDARIKGLVNPYSLKDSNGLRFRADVPRRGFLNMKLLADAIKIHLDTTQNVAMANNADIFNIEVIYNTHTDYAAEVYYKYMKMKSKAYQKYLKSMLKPSRNKIINVVHQMPIADWERVLFGIYTNPKEQANRPLSKFIKDLLDDFKEKGL